MKLGKTIKKVLGIIYVSLFSFALSVGTVKSGGVETFAVDSTVYDLSWSWNDLDYPTACYAAEYHDNEYDCTIVATPQSATYDIGEATLEVTCLTGNDGMSNAPQELVDQTILFNYDVLSANTDGDPLYFSGTRDGNTESIELSRSIVDITGQGDPQTGNEYYFESDGSLMYHAEDGEEYSVTIVGITYHNYMMNPDIVLSVFIDDIEIEASIVVTGSFNPEPEETGSYSGTLTCYLPAAVESSELLLSGIDLTIADAPQYGWSYDSGNLDYTSESIEITDVIQSSVVQTASRSFTVTYDIYEQNVQDPTPMSVYFTDAEYETNYTGGNVYGYLSGDCDVIESADPITINITVQPSLMSYVDGWNYISAEHTLVYYDSNEPNHHYNFGWAHFTQYDCTALILYTCETGGGADNPTIQIQEAIFDASAYTISGYLAPEDPTNFGTYIKGDTYVVLQFEEEEVQEYYTYGWNYSQTLACFIYYDNDGTTYDELEPTTSTFYEMNSGINQYAEISYSFYPDGANEPIEETFTITNANYQDSGSYRITGNVNIPYNGSPNNIPVDFVLNDLTVLEEFIPGYRFIDQSLVYYEDRNEPCRTEITQVIWNYYQYVDEEEDSKYNEILIDCEYTDSEEEVHTDRLTIKGGVFDSEPGGQNNEGYLHGVYEGEEIMLATSHLEYKNVIEDGYNYLEGLNQAVLYYATTDVRYKVQITSIYYNVGKDKLQVYSNLIDDEEQSTINSVIELTNPGDLSAVPNQSENVALEGWWADVQKRVVFIAPIFSRVNDTSGGWHYENSELKYYDPIIMEDYVAYDFSCATFNVENNEMEIEYEIDYSTPTQGQTSNVTDSLHIVSPQIEERILGDGTSYEVTGVCREVNATVTLVIPEYYRNSTGWKYDSSDGLYYNDSTYGWISHEFYDASYYPDKGYIVVTYTLKYSDIPNEQLSDKDEDLIITNPSFREENSGNEIYYEVTGGCEAVDETIKVEIPYYETRRTGWEYNGDGLFYTDEEYGEIDIGVSSVDYYKDTKTVLVTYNLFYSVTSEGEVDDKTEVFTITNASVKELEDSGKTSYLITGYSSNVNSEVELEYSILNYMDPSWVYDNRGDMYIDLYWNDPSHQDYETIISNASYNEEFKTVNIVYGIYTYETNTGDGSPSGDEPSNEKPELIMEKVIHMTEVQKPYRITKDDNPEFEETMVFVRGTNTDVPEAELLSIPESKFNTIYYDPDAGTITPDQQIDIKELLPEETSVDEQRMEESVVAISSETAHEIIVTVNDAHEENDAKLASGEITPEKHAENKQIIETVTEASVVVGAGATTASDEGKAVDNALPEDNELGFTMDETLSEFYQLQMDYLLGRRKAPGEEDNSRGILRVGEPITNSGSINLNISAADYAKMINFVDTAVSNMKDAALQIRKCSASKMKKVVGDYIQVVKVSSFREFDATAAENEFVDAVYKAIMLNMQQQVIEALKRDHKPTNNPEKELLYRQQLEVCEDFDTFEELVLEVLRQKYNAISNAAEVGIDEFRDTYRLIFRSWALNKPEENPSSITLEQLTTATIETTKTNANRFEYRGSFDNRESLVFIIFGAIAVLGIASAITVPILVNKSKQKRA